MEVHFKQVEADASFTIHIKSQLITCTQTYVQIPSHSVIFYDDKESLRYEGLPKDNIGGITFLRLSKVGERAFCLDCHTPLAMRYRHEDEVVHLPLGSVDESGVRDDDLKKALMPTNHIFWEQRVWWLGTIDDGLPRRARFGGDFEEEIRAWEGKEG